MNQKREVPKEVIPVNYKGITYKTDSEKNKHYVLAIKSEDNKELWKQEIYSDKINKDLELDVQLNYIDDLTLDKVKKLLIIKNEKGDFYSLNLKTKKIIFIANQKGSYLNSKNIKSMKNTKKTKSKKRKPPKKVEPINYNGIKYKTYREYFTHFIVAIQESSKEKLWKQRIYTNTIGENKETDVQIKFINDLELDTENNQLIIKSENHNFYTLNLKNRKVDFISISSFELGECILTYDVFKKGQQEWESKEKQSFTWLNNKKAKVFIKYIDIKKDDDYIQQIDKTLFNLTKNADTVKFEISTFLNIETKFNRVSAKPEIIFSQCSLFPIYIYKKGNSIYMEITFRYKNDDYIFYLKDGLTYKKRKD